MRIKESERICPQMFVHSTWTELIWPEQVDPVTRRVHWSRAWTPRIYFVFIGCSETRTVSARLVLNVTYAAWLRAVIGDFGSLVVRLDVSDYCSNCNVLRWVKIKKKSRVFLYYTVYQNYVIVTLCLWILQSKINQLITIFGAHIWWTL